MDSSIKEQWVTALRSGEYDQGKGQLSASGTYCCLGVLCELAVKAGVTKRFSPADARYPTQLVSYGQGDGYDDGTVSYLPTEVAEWAGLHDTNPVFEAQGMTMWLSNLNDAGSSFEEIADDIETHF